MEKIHVTDDSWSQSNGGTNGKPIDRPRDDDAGPVRTVARNDVGDGSEERARHHDGPAAGGAREGHDEQRPDAREHEIYHELVRCLDGRDAKRAAESDEGRVRRRSPHRPNEGHD